MKLSKTVMILSTLCFLVTGCATKREAVSVRPDRASAERLVCEAAPSSRPAIPPSYRIDWKSVQTVQAARSEHEAYVRSVKDRNGAVGAYLTDIEGRLFVCSNNAQWWRDYWNGLPE